MKENNTWVYKIARPVLGPVYKFWYKPTIIGAENIPTDGPILLVGNHIHIMDQCNVIVSTKRLIHYMAKKEYFDPQYKEGKFGWFFRSAGCIPVDRKIHDDAAKEAALDVLNNKLALGLFPEGTRNGIKEERANEINDKYFNENKEEFYKKLKKNKTSQVNYLEELMNNKVITKEEFKENIFRVDDYLKELIKSKKIKESDYYENYLLPFKFGAVSMAQKTDAYLVPYAITGEYKFKGDNLVVRIGKPFKVEKDDDLEKANKKLRKVVLDLIKENKNNEK